MSAPAADRTPEWSVVFMGTSSFACPALQALHDDPRIQLQMVVTQPDRPGGRKLKPLPSPVKSLAIVLQLPLMQPAKARDESFLQDLQALRPDLIVVASYGQILPQALLETPRHGCLNIHASLLPKYRGAAPIQWAILNGDRETGVTIMKMDAGLDTGAMVAARSTPIGEEDTGQSLHDRLAAMGAALLLEVIPEYIAGRRQPEPQPEEGTCYARKITREDGRVHWNEPACHIARRIRALAPWPGTHTTWQAGGASRLLKIWKAHPLEDGLTGTTPGQLVVPASGRLQVVCGEGLLELEEIQMEGGKRLSVEAFLSGHTLQGGEMLE